MAEQTAAPARKFKSKKKLTLATFKLEKEKMLYFLALGPIHRGVQRGTPKKRADGSDEEPPMLMHVLNMETGEHGQIMVAKIIETELSEQFPNEGYIGHAFGVMKGERKPGKRYDPYEIEEVEIPPELVEASVNAVREFNSKIVELKPSDVPASPPGETKAPESAPSSRRR